MILEIGPQLIIQYILSKELPNYYINPTSVDITVDLKEEELIVDYDSVLITKIKISTKEPDSPFYESIELVEDEELYISFLDHKEENVKTKWLDNFTFLKILESLEEIYY